MVAAGHGWHELTARESAVLAAVERRLSNAEIAAEFFISVRTVESHIASLRRKLEVDSRAKLIAAARARRGTAVPVPQNSFVGRGDDLETLRRLLERERWVTIVGPAGCGKTRLALELAAGHGRIPIVAELEHAAPSEVVRTVARAIGLGSDSAGDLVTACGVALEAQRYLLVIDNCDRVAAAVNRLVGQLLVVAGSLAVLTTSRSPVGGSDEALYQLTPLQVDEIDATSAVQLFIDRATSAAPSAHFTDTDKELIAQICRRLDGLPLAIELGAARIRHLPLPELASRLEEGFEPLDRAGPASRHRTLETAFDWSWDLLDDDERWVLSRLAALPWTFDLELAEAVTWPGARSIVIRLLDRSLVSGSDGRDLSPGSVGSPPKADNPTRFRLLDSLRAFVLDRTSHATVREVRLAHADFHASLAGLLADRARADDSRLAAEASRRLSPETSAAIHWAVTERHELALRLARAKAVLAEQYGPDIDSLEALARAAGDPHVRNAATTTDLLVIGLALCYGDLDRVVDLAARALEIADDDRSALAAHHLAGTVSAYRHDGKAALAHLELAERLANEQADFWQLASVRQARGIALRASELQDLPAALAEFQASMRTYALAGDPMHVNNARYMMASVAAQLGDPAGEAVDWAEECAAYAQNSGNRHELAHAVLTRAAVSAGPGVEADLSEAVETFRRVGDLRCLTRSYVLLALQRPPPEQLPHLLLALDVANRAHDTANQATVLEHLIRAQWESNSHRDAAVTLGALSTLIGYEAALERCPAAMVDGLDHWDAAVAEGQARMPRSPTASPPT